MKQKNKMIKRVVWKIVCCSQHCQKREHVKIKKTKTPAEFTNCHQTYQSYTPQMLGFSSLGKLMKHSHFALHIKD